MSWRALSIRQPWAWAILHAGKDIENRSWQTHYRGRFLIHASKRIETSDHLDLYLSHDAPEHLPTGGIVGMAELVSVCTSSHSSWFTGPFGFVLSNVQPLPFLPLKGARGWFGVPPDIVKQLGIGESA